VEEEEEGGGEGEEEEEEVGVGVEGETMMRVVGGMREMIIITKLIVVSSAPLGR
jgi:hypothetical protein